MQNSQSDTPGEGLDPKARTPCPLCGAPDKVVKMPADARIFHAGDTAGLPSDHAGLVERVAKALAEPYSYNWKTFLPDAERALAALPARPKAGSDPDV